MIACLDLHDFTVSDNRLDLLLKLKERWPDFKVSLFMIPIDKNYSDSDLLLVKENLDWLQLIPHGLKHTRFEMRYCRNFEKVMAKIDEVFKQYGLPYEKGFCAPHWRWNEHVVRTLDEHGWWGAVDRRQPKMLKTRRYYKYNFCLDEKYQGEMLKLHGHVKGTKNDLEKCFNNLMALPDKINWQFVTRFINDTL